MTQISDRIVTTRSFVESEQIEAIAEEYIRQFSFRIKNIEKFRAISKNKWPTRVPVCPTSGFVLRPVLSTKSGEVKHWVRSNCYINLPGGNESGSRVSEVEAFWVARLIYTPFDKWLELQDRKFDLIKNYDLVRVFREIVVCSWCENTIKSQGHGFLKKNASTLAGDIVCSSCGTKKAGISYLDYFKYKVMSVRNLQKVTQTRGVGVLAEPKGIDHFFVEGLPPTTNDVN